MKNKIDCIYLDLDGVLVDFIGGVLAMYDLDPKLYHEMTDYYGINAFLCEKLGHKVDVWADIALTKGHFWRTLDWTPNGREIVTRLSRLGVPILIVTKPTRDPYCALGKTQWIQRELKQYRLDRNYSMCTVKSLIAGPSKLLIDDCPDNLIAFKSAGGHVVQAIQPWGVCYSDKYQGYSTSRLLEESWHQQYTIELLGDTINYTTPLGITVTRD